MNAVERAKSILLSPNPTWETINTAPAETAGQATGYLMLLAAIPAVCGSVGLLLISMNTSGAPMRGRIDSALTLMVVWYVVNLMSVYVVALIIYALTPVFGGLGSLSRAIKVAVYSSTAALLGGAFLLWAALAVLGLLASLYSIYLLYTGLPVLMKIKPEKASVYTALVVLAVIVLWVAVWRLGAHLGS